MRSERHGWLAGVALVMLAVPAPPTGARVMLMPLCGGGSHPVPIDGPERPGHGCAMACHALCERRRPEGGHAGG